MAAKQLKKKERPRLQLLKWWWCKKCNSKRLRKIRKTHQIRVSKKNMKSSGMAQPKQKKNLCKKKSKVVVVEKFHPRHCHSRQKNKIQESIAMSLHLW
jgi:hypothetical protein